MNFAVARVTNGFIVTVTPPYRPGHRNPLAAKQIIAKDEKELSDVITKVVKAICKAKPVAPRNDNLDLG